MSKENNWRRHLDLVVEQNLSELISETKEYSYAISQAKDKSKAQMWVAMALLNKKLNDLLLNENFKSEKKLSKKELDEVLKTLEKL